VKYKILFFDYETFSLLNLKEVGIDNYAKHPSTGISMLGWALDDEDVEVWLPHEGAMPEKLLDAFLDPTVIKVAWHAPFEYNITNQVAFGPRYCKGGRYIPMQEFRDPEVLAHNASLPGKLEKVAIILKMQEKKDERGKELVKMFSQPVSMGGEQTLFGVTTPLFRDHNSHPREFAEYIEYCKQDVRAERGLWYKLSKLGFPEEEWRGWLLDQKLNEFGIPVRRDLAEKGLRLARRYIKEQKDTCKQLTGLENPNSDVQMKGWAKDRGYTLNSLLASTVEAELNNPSSTMTPECKIALKARMLARKSSYTKIENLLHLLGADDRLRYQLRFMGAPRTGRWASGGGDEDSMQVQNMSRGAKLVKKNLARALELLEAEDYDGIVREFTNTPNPKDSVSVVAFVITLLRSLFQAKLGKVFHVADKNAIENRMLGWAAGCEAILDVFRKGRDPYMAFGVYLYGIPYEEWIRIDEHGNHKPKNAEFEEKRQNSKPPVLGGGYCLGGGELYIDEHGDQKRGGLWGYALSVCGVDMPKDLAHKAVKILRDAWPEVPIFWTDLEEAFKQVFKRGGCIKVGEVTWGYPPPDGTYDPTPTKQWVEHPTKGQGCVITFRRIKMDDGHYTIRMELPSGRALHYLNVSIEEEERTSKKTGKKYTARTIYYDGIEHSATQGADGKTAKKKHKWGRVKTYGGKICENAIQAMSRDDLLNSMFLADEMGFHIWGLFHDEIAVEEDDVWDGLRLDDLLWCMCQIPWWAPGLMLGAEGYTDKVYKKG